MKTVLLTGGSGFVGANLARKLLAQGHNLHLLLRPNHQDWRIKQIANDVIIHQVDLCDSPRLERVIAQIKPDWVYHLATSGAYSWQNDARQIVQTNINGTVNLLEACLKTGFEVFINTGSSSEYGLKDHAPTENDVLDPNSYYATTKAFNTQYCRLVSQNQKMNIVTLRLYSAYGPFEDPKRFIPTLLVHGLHGKLPPLVDPMTARDFVYVEDVVGVYAKISTASGIPFGTVLNLGSGIQTTIGDAVDVTRTLLNIEQPPAWGAYENRQWDTDIWVANIEKIQKTLNWKPRFTLKQGLLKTLEWFQCNPEYLDFYRSKGSL